MKSNVAIQQLDGQGLPIRDTECPEAASGPAVGVISPDATCPDCGAQSSEPKSDRVESDLEAAELDLQRSETEPGDRTTDSGGDKPLPPDWGVILTENEPWLRTVIAARVGEPAAVDEVFQEVSLAAIRQQAPIHDLSKICPWLYRLAITQSLLYRRTMGRKKKLITRYTEKIPVVEYDQKQPDPLEWLTDQERFGHVREAMSTLPKAQQELLMLKYVHEWSYRDMAEHLGITVSAVQAKLHRARGLLREKLEKKKVDCS